MRGFRHGLSLMVRLIREREREPSSGMRSNEEQDGAWLWIQEREYNERLNGMNEGYSQLSSGRTTARKRIEGAWQAAGPAQWWAYPLGRK